MKIHRGKKYTDDCTYSNCTEFYIRGVMGRFAGWDTGSAIGRGLSTPVGCLLMWNWAVFRGNGHLESRTYEIQFEVVLDDEVNLCCE